MHKLLLYKAKAIGEKNNLIDLLFSISIELNDIKNAKKLITGNDPFSKYASIIISIIEKSNIKEKDYKDIQDLFAYYLLALKFAKEKKLKKSKEILEFILGIDNNLYKAKIMYEKIKAIEENY